MKRIFFIPLFTSISLISLAQNNVGIGTATPHASAVLDISSSSKGALMPRMTEAQRLNITQPAKGLLIYQTTTPEGFYYNAGTPELPGWITLGATGPQGPAGMVRSYTIAANGLIPTPVLSFVSPTLTVNIEAGQKVFLTASQSLGTYRTFLDDTEALCIYPAYISTNGVDVIHNLDLGVCGLKILNGRTMLSINGVFENLPAGTYKFGMSGLTGPGGAGVWSNREWGYVTALVF